MVRRAPVPEGKSVFFRKLDVPPVATADIVEGEEAVAGRRTRQSAIFLEERHLDWLDDKCREARRSGGRAIRKAVIIRTLLDVAMEAPIDLTSLRDEDDLKNRLRNGLRG